ncbi:uncharacterized protein LOC141909088 [Tubulanus polymorphus]|uniref:uncharacterized protein LOC141909088 n=1 Tax=Tubulanus polymorphus TaxID=672921 RepID=UPI003DA3FD8A
MLLTIPFQVDDEDLRECLKKRLDVISDIVISVDEPIWLEWQARRNQTRNDDFTGEENGLVIDEKNSNGECRKRRKYAKKKKSRKTLNDSAVTTAEPRDADTDLPNVYSESNLKTDSNASGESSFPSHHSQNKRRRRPSATVTSPAATTTDEPSLSVDRPLLRDDFTMSETRLKSYANFCADDDDEDDDDDNSALIAANVPELNVGDTIVDVKQEPSVAASLSDDENSDFLYENIGQEQYIGQEIIEGALQQSPMPQLSPTSNSMHWTQAEDEDLPTSTRPRRCRTLSSSMAKLRPARRRVNAKRSPPPLPPPLPSKDKNGFKLVSEFILENSHNKMEKTTPLLCGAKIVKCAYCDKPFSTNQNKVIHERIHLGIKPYECQICHRFFTHASNYKRHLRTMHAVENKIIDSTEHYRFIKD